MKVIRSLVLASESSSMKRHLAFFKNETVKMSSLMLFVHFLWLHHKYLAVLRKSSGCRYYLSNPIFPLWRV